MKIIKEEKNQEPGIRSQTRLRPTTARQGSEVGRLEWWDSLSSGERKLICSLMRMLRGAKRSQLLDVARAAAKWERGIGCFIKVRLVGENRKAESRKWKWIGLTQRREGAIYITVENTSSGLRPPSPQRGEGITRSVTSCR
jgi:hypothetical protein